MRKLVPILGAAAVGLLAAGTASGHRVGPAAAACAKAGLATLEDGKLTIGTDNPAYPPWFDGGAANGSSWKLNDPANGNGFESAVAWAVASGLGFAKSEVEWKPTGFNQSFRPGKKSFDIYLAQVSYSPVRARAVDFSSSYYDVD